MAKKMLNIEIGDQVVKVCVTAKRSRGIHATNSFCFDTPQMSVMDGEIIQPDLIAQELEKEMKAHGVLDVKNVIFSLSTSKVVSREVVFPLVKKGKIKTMVLSNASEYFPVDLAGYQVSYVLLETKKGENAGHRILITAVPTQILNSYEKMLSTTGLTLEAFDYSANGQYQIFKGLQAPGVTMYVALASNQTLATFMKDGKLLLQRTFPFGGDSVISSAMMRSRAEEPTYAEILEKCKDQEWLDNRVDKEEQNDTYERLANGIVRIADFFKSSNDSEEISKVVLLGTCAELAGIDSVIQKAMSVDVLKLSQMQGVDKVVSGTDVAFYANCMGSSISPLELTPTKMVEIKKKKKNEDSLLIPIVFAGACVLAGAGMVAGSTLDYFSAKDDLVIMEERIANLSSVTGEYRAYVEYEGIRYNLELLEAEGISNNANLREFLEELEDNMPSSILLLSASCDNFGISMNVEVPDMESAAVVISQLDAFETIENISVSGVVESDNDAGVQTATFSISCEYALPEPVEVPPTVAAQTEEQMTEAVEEIVEE